MTPGVGVLVLRYGHISYIVKIPYFFKKSYLYSQVQIRQTEGIVNMSEEGSTKFCKFHDPKGRVSCAGARSYSEHDIFITLWHRSDKLSIKQL